ncbi:MAG: cytochrome b N-terminal domain-containing protein [Gammaproteobacteria bacterium]|jgi:ubiquinol-cytochrome c reductase cytochrome b subunit|nr:cytochrome b [Pseudomonadota bacterium]MDG2301950.1 cytochrome b N-terminal domain-containing protein [Gammaproteobacteria bacterium]MBT5064759.1 cytochrome b [Pseudomonadota bacterium]MBT6194125.1 cytochrome b [Pseudomonadota bacterium]MBT6465398.1 cytochrome b [Pseudomonadota bacterium]
MQLWNEHVGQYYAPKNFNFWYYFGVLALVVLVIQILTGIWLVMSYKPDANFAFASVEYMMRDVEWGWLIRYMHSTGASFFFIVIYLHMFRGIMYGSYQKPRELLWILGMCLYLALMAEAFFGYLLPWGQMSYWGAQVIISLFGAIPFVGETLSLWIRGDYVVSDITLNRFFAFHVIALPFAIAGLVVLHILALHHVGSNNPDGIDIKANKNAQGNPVDGIPFHPYYTTKDAPAVVALLILMAVVIFFAPEMGGYFLEHNNFVPADPLKTPEHIAPVWYFTPFYSILRANTINFFMVPAKLWGVIFMGLGTMVFFLLPWLDKGKVRSIRYRGWIYKTALGLFVVSFLILGYLGLLPPTPARTALAQVCTVIYFLFFLLMPFYTKWDKTKPVPERVT